MTKNILGLEKKDSKESVESLNGLLANFQIYYQSLRGLHWNIKGKNFFELHVKFEELYTDSQVKIDEIAERILTLQGKPLHTFKDYIEHANVPVGKNISNDEEAVELVVTSLSKLLEIERVILDLSDESDDEGTNAMMSDFISEQEKTIWMLNSWLGK
ncbi:MULTISPECIES: Dps family protein [unclassified Polaribacter]|uniref:Dps family protein n=1 Tax=unclassified Polaribacter TaxID=196858 RepID=UPI0011BFB001|nr:MULTISPECIES: Dps family protein [unclassified Polaribacter]TXD51522.1 DNA starvation/stationary phase protection protein [Polaribacter sp. IC063]TXD58101.1 DNA starvation/stationary phase protection protein [Polaribacter sp. IC066]